MTSLAESITPVPAPVRVLTVVGKLRALAAAYAEHDLLTFASALSFQVLSAIVPFLGFIFGLLGFLHLEDVWRNDLAVQLKPNVSAAAFTVVDDVVETALSAKPLFWVTAGLAIAIWQISGAVRTVMGALNRLYRLDTERSLTARLLVSFALSVGVGICFLLALTAMIITPLLYGDVGASGTVALFLGRCAVAGGLCLTAVAMLMRFAPEHHQPIGRVGFGSLVVVGAWVLMSGGFGVYLREIASYGSVFSSLATVVVLMAYLYLSAVIFLGGIQVDALVREHRRKALP